MAEPVTLAIIASAVSTGASVYGEVQQGRAAKAEAETEAAWHQYNAKIAEQEAKVREEQAAVQSSDARRQAQQLLARQRTAIAASGLSMAGSPLLVMNETAGNLERSIMEVSRQGLVETQQLRSQAGMSLFQADSAKIRGRNAQKAGYISALSTGFSGGAQALHMNKTKG